MISHADVVSIINQHSGNRLFGEAIAEADSPSKILRILALYAEFNFDFGPCIASLAAQVTFQRALFVDRSAEAFADRSYEVAAGIFNAAVDEFGGRSKKRPATHRMMVQRLVLDAARHLGVSPSALGELLRRERPGLEPLLHRIAVGYGVGARLDAESTFRAIGFHLGQELCGDEEFHVLHASLKAHHGGLLQALGETHSSAWITAHLTAESEHFDQALVSVTRAFAYCSSDGTEILERCVLEGIEAFARFQHDCVRVLASPPAVSLAPSAGALAA